MHPCEKCGEPIEDRYRVCYVCWMRKVESESQNTPYNGVINYQRRSDVCQTANVIGAGVTSSADATAPTYVPPVGSGGQRYEQSRNEAIARAHEENILASAALTAAILELAAAIKKGG